MFSFKVISVFLYVEHASLCFKDRFHCKVLDTNITDKFNTFSVKRCRQFIEKLRMYNVYVYIIFKTKHFHVIYFCLI